MDTYNCVLDFYLLTCAPREELAEYFRYMPDQAQILAVDPEWLEHALREDAKEMVSDTGIVRNGNVDILSDRASLPSPSVLFKLSAEEAAALTRSCPTRKRF